MDSKVATKLHAILEEFSEAQESREDVLLDCVRTRLDKSLLAYYQDLTDGVQWLSNHNSLNVLRRLGK